MENKQAIDCYHCGEVVPKYTKFEIEIFNKTRQMCCIGCVSVAETIVSSGLTDYYRHRTDNAPSAQGLVPEALQQMLQYDQAAIQKEFVASDGEFKEVLLSVEGISCAACAWLIERQLSNMPGVQQIRVNSTTQRATLKWDDEQIKLSQILQAAYKIGYSIAPFETDKQEEIDKKNYRKHLLRLGIAGLASMQVMMFAIALYGDLFFDMEAEFIDYFRWVSLICATPVLLFSAQPFYISAFKSLRNKTLNMDVPVSIALLGAYSASMYATIKGSGEVYFESVCMFTFLLLLGRMLEIRARRKASENSSNLLKLVPKLANRINLDGSTETIAASQLQVDDFILVKPGETIPADGEIIDGESQLDESMLSGESTLVSRCQGDTVYAGTVNHEQTLKLKVTAVAQATFVAHIIRMQEQAQLEKPKIATLADHVARYFVAAILVISAITYGYWSIYQPEDAFWITLAVLVATCPCALSLATPAALTTATHRLSKMGLLIKRGHVLENLASLKTVVSDKTGTLTTGKMTIQQVSLLPGATVSEQQAIDYATALEQHSSHPIAECFHALNTPYQANNLQHVAGFGIEAQINQQQVSFGRAVKDYKNPDQALLLLLRINGEEQALFYMSDSLKSDAVDFSKRLAEQQIDLVMLTGDSSSQVQKVAKLLNIQEVHSGALPQDKLAIVKTMSQQNHNLMMIGDGVNDSPVLAAAPLSVAMGLGTDIAKSSADAILLNGKLNTIHQAHHLAKRTQKVIKQNLAISLGYNLTILPLAMMGLVAPYMAAIGMSLSSLVVLSNSLRLNKETD